MPSQSILKLKRRGFDLGTIERPESINKDPLNNWQLGSPILLKGLCENLLASSRTQIEQSHSLYTSINANKECDHLLAQPPYSKRLNLTFESLGSGFNEGDKQEIETVFFDATDKNTDTIIAEDLWMKVSWLSFDENDVSLRFRFSFGVDFEEDVAADPNRQHYAALLADVVFPESAIITQNDELNTTLNDILNCESINYVERIVYFNAPNGGAYLHHDRERGHAGVVYAQLSGTTFWLALAKSELINEIQIFINQCEIAKVWPESLSTKMQEELTLLASDKTKLSNELDSFANSTLIHTINETSEFVQYLIKQQHGQLVEAGDILLLPQETDENCCWHCVFCIGEETGEALSFATKRT